MLSDHCQQSDTICIIMMKKRVAERSETSEQELHRLKKETKINQAAILIWLSSPLHCSALILWSVDHPEISCVLPPYVLVMIIASGYYMLEISTDRDVYKMKRTKELQVKVDLRQHNDNMRYRERLRDPANMLTEDGEIRDDSLE